ncbi:MAG: N-acetyl-gamma-glutamyl-phosphate reductase, partial [Lentisphaeria bacterium]|nr:N-acetyl-gamma-glutamyl-phosphate reductase [Lentisphaeria bacterium]
MKKIRVAVFGAAGYAGEELLRILLRHPQAEITAVTSRKNAGEPVSSVFPRYT